MILADAGWKVLIHETQTEPGGSVQTAEVTLAGFQHDLYATNLNAFAGSAFVQKYAKDLARHGFELARASNAFCSIFPDGDLIGVTTSRDQTLTDFGRLSPHDARVWSKLTQKYQTITPHVVSMLREPMPSWAALRVALHCPLGVLSLVFGSSGGFVRRHFTDPKVRAMWAVWGMHLDFAPETAGGALYPFLQCMMAQDNGLQLGKGGARTMIDALIRLFREKGGELRCSSRVDEVLVENGAAIGVMTGGGERIVARRAVIANLTPTGLAARLAGNSFPRLQKTARRFRYGPGTMMIHLALAGLPSWINQRAGDYLYVHIAPSLETMSQAYRDASTGTLPHQPVLIVAQPTVVDPTRAPPGRHILSIQVRMVPSALDWDAIKESYADRMIDLLERYAPGLRQLILGRHVLSPADLERANANLVGGDSLAGSHRLSQQFMFRPFFGWSRYRTPIARLYLCGASTWPGAGVGAGSGWILGHMLAGDG